MHNLAASFVLGYHGCDREAGERLLRNEDFLPSTNKYDWLGSGIYFWQANPDRARQWAIDQQKRGRLAEPFVLGAVIDLGYCLDLTTTNGISAVRSSFTGLSRKLQEAGLSLPSNSGGKDLLLRNLDCAVINYLHMIRAENADPPFDTVRALFHEGNALYPDSGFEDKTHVQICVRNQENIHGVFRVHPRYFS
jgi:hypothetical protein